MLRAERGHLAGTRRGRRGEGSRLSTARHGPGLAPSSAGTPPPARRGLGAARPFPPREPSPISAGPGQTGFMSAGGPRVRGGRRHLTLSLARPPLWRALPSSPPRRLLQRSVRRRGRHGKGETRGGGEAGSRP